MFSPKNNYWGGYGIAAAQTPVAAGLAFAQKYINTQGISICFLGEGSVNQGVFHETLNLASLFELPVVYIIENNIYSFWTHVDKKSAYPESLAKRAESYNIEWSTCKSWDIMETRNCLEAAFNSVRTNGRPYVVEIHTYRFYGFTVADTRSNKCRTSEEIEFHKEYRDPLKNWRQHILKEQILSESEILEIDSAAKKEANSAADFAKISPAPTAANICEDVYWEVDHHTEQSKNGKYFFNS